MTDPAQRAPAPISIGDTVHLKSGGPAMTVAGFSVSPAPAALQCYWMTRDGVLQMHAFPEALVDGVIQAGDPSFSAAARLGNLQTRVATLESEVSLLRAQSFSQADELNTDRQKVPEVPASTFAADGPVPFGGVTTSESPTTTSTHDDTPAG